MSGADVLPCCIKEEQLFTYRLIVSGYGSV